jgi:hypothetical protein
MAFLIIQMNVIVKQRRYSCLCLVNNCQIKINKIAKKNCVLIFRKSYNSWPIIKFEINLTTMLANIKYIKIYHCWRGEVTIFIWQLLTKHKHEYLLCFTITFIWIIKKAMTARFDVYPKMHCNMYIIHLNICVTNVHGYVPLIVNTSRFFPHSWLACN